jgi:hypothetical protein
MKRRSPKVQKKTKKLTLFYSNSEQLCIEVVRTSSGEVVEELEPNSALTDLLTKFSFPRIKEFKVILIVKFYMSIVIGRCSLVPTCHWMQGNAQELTCNRRLPV